MPDRLPPSEPTAAPPRRASAAPHGPEGRARMMRFGAVGVVNTATDFLVFAGLVAAGAPALGANLAGFLAANLQSYILNARLTFGPRGGFAPMSLGGYFKFALGHGAALILSTLMILLLADRLGPLAAKGLAIAVGFVFNYWFSAAFVFAPSPPDAAALQEEKPGGVTPESEKSKGENEER